MPDLSSLPEAFVSTPELAKMISRQVKIGALRKLSSRLYTKNLSDPAEAIAKRNLWPIVAGFLPGALIADRTALENRPASDGSIFLVSDHTRDIALPGIVLRPRKGPPPLPSDRAFIGSLRLASTPRAFLENLVPSRARTGVARTLPRTDIEKRLDDELRARGEPALQRLRDDARAIAKDLDLEKELRELDAMIGALLGTRTAKLSEATAVARAAGAPYDPHRLELLQRLHSHLSNRSSPVRPATAAGAPLPFFEAYFSNFIEGTEFEVSEAENIVFHGHIPEHRPEDAHDIIGTWRIVSDAGEMEKLPGSSRELVALLKARHASIMQGRPNKRPGVFKTQQNQVGTTVFVEPKLVLGTLERGFELYRSIDAPLHRAMFMTFLVAEVHPFADGNGRTARIMMNAELVAAKESRIIIPTVYRNNYLMSLRLLSQNGEPDALVRTLDFAQRYTVSIDFTSLERARSMLEKTNAFIPANEADERGIRLQLPTPELLAR